MLSLLENLPFEESTIRLELQTQKTIRLEIFRHLCKEPLEDVVRRRTRESAQALGLDGSLERPEDALGARTPRDGLYGELLARSGAWPDQGVKSVERIGDCLAPGAIVHAVYDGHRYGEALDRATRPERAERREHAFRDLAAPATELGAP